MAESFFQGFSLLELLVRTSNVGVKVWAQRVVQTTRELFHSGEFGRKVRARFFLLFCFLSQKIHNGGFGRPQNCLRPWRRRFPVEGIQIILSFKTKLLGSTKPKDSFLRKETLETVT